MLIFQGVYSNKNPHGLKVIQSKHVSLVCFWKHMFFADSIFACLRIISRTRIHPGNANSLEPSGSTADPHPALWALKIVTLLSHHHFDWHLAGFRATGFDSAHFLSHFSLWKTGGAQSLRAKVFSKVGYHSKRKVVFEPPFFSSHVSFAGGVSLAKIVVTNPKENPALSWKQ